MSLCTNEPGDDMLKLETRADLQRLIDDGVREDLHLEFKSGPAAANADKERNEMSKDVSAMANADGGQIVYGLKEAKAPGVATAVATEFWPVDGGRYTRETMEQVLRSKISPPIEGVKVHAIQVSENAADVAFVVEVPRAETLAPHQASDRKYYRRHGNTTDAMADYEVRDAMRRLVDPDLYATLEFSIVNVVTYQQFGVVPTLHNRSSSPAIYTALTVFVDKRLGLTSSHASPFNPDANVVGSHPMGFELRGETAQLSPPVNFPIFREHASTIGRSGWIYPHTLDGEFFGVGYRVAALGCEREEYFVVRAEKFRIVQIEKVT